jgi:hypothetical protein
MAKSEKKSKWKKKFRAIKRLKNKTKEVASLNKILEKSKALQTIENQMESQSDQESKLKIKMNFSIKINCHLGISL